MSNLRATSTRALVFLGLLLGLMLSAGTATAAVDGRNVSRVQYGSTRVKQGDFVMTGPRHLLDRAQRWEEHTIHGKVVHYVATRRDKWSVYLSGGTTKVQIDLYKKRIYITEGKNARRNQWAVRSSSAAIPARLVTSFKMSTDGTCEAKNGRKYKRDKPATISAVRTHVGTRRATSARATRYWFRFSGIPTDSLKYTNWGHWGVMPGAFEAKVSNKPGWFDLGLAADTAGRPMGSATGIDIDLQKGTAVSRSRAVIPCHWVLDEVSSKFTKWASAAQEARWEASRVKAMNTFFTKHPNSALSGLNHVQIKDQTAAQCSAACWANKSCFSFDYTKATKKCDLSRASWDSPTGKPKRTSSSKYDHYVLKPQFVPHHAPHRPQ